MWNSSQSRTSRVFNGVEEAAHLPAADKEREKAEEMEKGRPRREESRDKNQRPAPANKTHLLVCTTS